MLANIVPVEREVLKYRKWGRPFFPLRFLNLLPLSHMFGQAMATFIPPMLPGVVVFMRGYNPGEIVAQIKKRRVSVLVSVPKILDVLREHVVADAPARRPSARHARIESILCVRVASRWWRHRAAHGIFGLKFWAFVVGAAPLDAELEAFWGELGFAVIQGYGLTETAPIVSLNHPFGTKRGSVGKAIAGVEVKIADGRRDPRARRERDARLLRARRRNRRARSRTAGFTPATSARSRADGQMFIRGRKKEMIVTPEGLNVFPEDVERVLNQIPGRARLRGRRHGRRVGREERRRGRARARSTASISMPSCATANQHLADHQKIRRVVRWPEAGTAAHRGHAQAEAGGDSRMDAERRRAAGTRRPAAIALTALVAKYAGRSDVSHRPRRSTSSG